MHARIKEIAFIQSGIYQKEFPDGDVIYLQVKDFEDAALKVNRLNPSLLYAENLDGHLLEEGDLLFAAKGTSNFCALYHAEIGKAVASSAFFVIRIKDKELLRPNFLCWYLNHPAILALLKSQAVGSTIPSITKRMLEELVIKLPDRGTQQKIIEIGRLQQQESRLRQSIAQKRDLLLHLALYKIIKPINNI
jgi:restriction endonuclease S subunit